MTEILLPLHVLSDHDRLERARLLADILLQSENASLSANDAYTLLEIQTLPDTHNNLT